MPAALQVRGEGEGEDSGVIHKRERVRGEWKVRVLNRVRLI